MENYFYFENTTPPHNKFWSVMIKEIPATDLYSPYATVYKLIRKWGAIGTAGVLMEEDYRSYSEAERRKEKLIQEKIAKGYQAVM